MTSPEAETVALTLRLPREVHERLRRQSFTLRRPISDLIREAIDRGHFHAVGVWCDDCPPAYRPLSPSTTQGGEG